ncbi:flavin-containing monooxygenase [Spirosoma montaniterrae]|uniref:4-hydroxybenzoate brominase (decarboxylating) n=1 Tax=Spirosoma montaniterrae TaxID=1178516 RepID=A0A1P9X1N1_9BACT|nr:NAD(P)-binding domain-containing protein [Spirosoma montaniterrae]AQG81530.1 monooxygenase [Spirosoma montaniterrae]
MKDVCIIGAGSSGIAAAKTFHQQGIAFDCFEKGSGVGGNWRYNNDNGMSSAYRSLHINTNRNVMAYSDFPMPTEYPMFPHHSQIIQYFDSYVDHFGFRDKITFNTAVTNVSRNADSNGGPGTYHITTDTGLERDYKHVVVANGHHWNPRYPDPPFPGTFAGETLHSHYYKTPDQIQGRKLLIVGIGNSAVDIACEAARQYGGHPVTISTRSGAYIVPNWLMSLPFDSLANPFTSRLPLSVQRALLGFSLWLARGRQEDYGVPTPKRPMLSEHPTISQDLLNLAGRGLVRFKPNIRAFDGHTVVFDDDSRDDFDMVIYATGYRVTFPFFKQGFFNVEQSNDLQLYRRVVHPDFPGLYFLGLVQPLGAIMPLAETQSVWLAKLIKGECRLPDRATMQQAIGEEAGRNKRRYKQSARHTLQVDFHPYKQSIEREMRAMKI